MALLRNDVVVQLDRYARKQLYRFDIRCIALTSSRRYLIQHTAVRDQDTLYPLQRLLHIVQAVSYTHGSLSS
jgi:hypothetical protein